MAFFNINYPSDVMNKYMAMNVILPDDEDPVIRDKEGKYAVIYLLHGYTDDYTKWQRLTSIERYAKNHGIAVVMPEAGKSFYMDMAYGDPHFTHLTKELPKHLQKWFKISSDPQYTYIAGLSMGGYGAMKIALTYPERFNGAATFSGALAMAQTAGIKQADDAPEWLKRLDVDLPLAFGDVTKLENGPHDLFWLLQDNKAKGKKWPHLYVSCGTEDFIYQATKAFAGTLEALEIPFKYHEEAETHNWAFWDREVDKFLDWIVSLS